MVFSMDTNNLSTMQTTGNNLFDRVVSILEQDHVPIAGRAGIIERWGSGTLNIIDWYMENGNPTPTWKEQAGSVYVTFLPAELPVAGQVGTRREPIDDLVTGEVTGGAEAG